ncbi:MAG: sodium/proline symporter [Balneolaceae bacterium]|nr:MAG: sodium/proline symporter [Balneolaceae bacterium]
MEETTVLELAVDRYAIGAFATYLLIIVGLGVWASRFSSRGVGHFFIGGRRMNHIVVALSAVVSGRSAWLLLGVTGMAYTMGASAVWAVVGYIVVELFLFLYFARRIRNFAGRYDCITIPDFFAVRFNDRSGILRIVLVAVILIFMLGYVSAQFVAGGKTFASSFHLDPFHGILLTAVIVFLYTILGGFLAVSLTDTIQAVFMLLSLVVLPVLIILDLGGWVAVVATLAAMDPGLVDPAALGMGAALGFLAIGLGSPGNPHIIARYLSISDSRQLRTAAVVGTTWNVLMGWGAVFIGLAGRVVLPDVAVLPAGDTENLFPVLAQQYLHPVLFGMVIASIFAAIMSTADSQLLVAASSVVRDVYEKILKKDEEVSQRRLVWMSRLVVGLLVAGAVVFGVFAEDLVFWLVLFAWAGLGAAIGPTALLALYWRRTTAAGVVSGFLSGALVTIVWYLVPALNDMMYELIPGFAAGFIVTVAVSLSTSPPKETSRFFEAMKDDQIRS